MDHAEINRLEFRHGKRGEILYRGVGKWRRLPPGNPGDLLRIQEDGLPEWTKVKYGNLRCLTGTYIGTGSQQTIDLGEGIVIKHIIVICPPQGPPGEPYTGGFYHLNENMSAYAYGIWHDGTTTVYNSIYNQLVLETTRSFRVDGILSESGTLYYFTVWYEVV
jgi:hypothetical protein